MPFLLVVVLVFCTPQRPRFLLPLYFIQSGLHSSGKIYKRPSNDLAFVLTHGFYETYGWRYFWAFFFFFFPYWQSKNYMSPNANMNLTSHVVMVLMEPLWCLLWRDVKCKCICLLSDGSIISFSTFKKSFWKAVFIQGWGLHFEFRFSLMFKELVEK